MGTEIPLVARQMELLAAAEVLDTASHGHGRGLLISGEAGIGKTRLLRHLRADAETRQLTVLNGRAVEAGGAFRPLVEAFARPAAPFVNHPEMVSVRPTLARLLPGWAAPATLMAPMADPAAVLAEALILLLQVMARAADNAGSVLLIDDVQWADPDTLSVVSSLVDSLDSLPLALILATRAEPHLPPHLHRLSLEPTFGVVSLRRLPPAEVEAALHGSRNDLAKQHIDWLVTRIDGLPLVLDEIVRHLQEQDVDTDQFDAGPSMLASAVQTRLTGLTLETRHVLDALAVIGNVDADVVAAATGLTVDRISAALRDALKTSLLVTASTPLGVGWRHLLIGEAVLDLLLPLERQAFARRAADALAGDEDANDGRLRQAAKLYEIAGYPNQAAHQLIRAARAAVAQGALDVAQQHLTDAQHLTGHLPGSARAVLNERIETLILAGRAADAYDSGTHALAQIDAANDTDLLISTARAAYAAGLNKQGRLRLRQLERSTQPDSSHLAVLRAQSAFAERQSIAVDLGEEAADRAQHDARFDLACEALVIAGKAANRRNTARARSLFEQAFNLAQHHGLLMWQVRAHTELGAISMFTEAESGDFAQARKTAAEAGMVGMVAELDRLITQGTIVREGLVAAYPIILRGLHQARQLRLSTLYARIHVHLVECIAIADQQVPGQAPQSGPAALAQALAEVHRVRDHLDPGTDHFSALGVRAWLHGENQEAIDFIDEDMRRIEDEIKIVPWFGIGGLLRVAEGARSDEAFGLIGLTGHHANWAARSLGTAITHLREGRPADDDLRSADTFVQSTPFWRHLLHTVAAPAAHQAGFIGAEAWLREADAFFTSAGELPLQRQARRFLGLIGAKVPRTGTSAIPPHLAKLGITAREADVLRLVNGGLGNAEIAAQLFISVRTVETHISSMLQKSGAASRNHLPVAETINPISRAR